MSYAETVCDTDPPRGRPHSLRGILGEPAWERLAPAVRQRFADPAQSVDYAGEFAIVRASRVGRVLAWACQLIGTPIVARTGLNVPAIVHVGPCDKGVNWRREYCWPDRSTCVVRSTKVIGADGVLVEELPAGLCMELGVYEEAGTLHFVSVRYYFRLPLGGLLGFPGACQIKLTLPCWLSPGTTHVEHVDHADGSFQFTMTVTHRILGEIFYQTGRFRARGE